MFSGLLTRTFSSQRLTKQSDSDKFDLQPVLTLEPCAIQQTGDVMDLGGGRIGKLHKMWCNIVDVKVGDRITDDGGTTYVAKSTDDMLYPNAPHLIVILSEQV